MHGGATVRLLQKTFEQMKIARKTKARAHALIKSIPGGTDYEQVEHFESAKSQS